MIFGMYKTGDQQTSAPGNYFISFWAGIDKAMVPCSWAKLLFEIIQIFYYPVAPDLLKCLPYCNENLGRLIFWITLWLCFPGIFFLWMKRLKIRCSHYSKLFFLRFLWGFIFADRYITSFPKTHFWQIWSKFEKADPRKSLRNKKISSCLKAMT